MKLEIGFDDESVGGDLPIALSGQDTVRDLITRIEKDAQIDGYSILALVLDSDAEPNLSGLASALVFKRTSIRVRRVCVEVHFETDKERHYFPSTARWARVHRWACRHFTIAPDACANLELRAGAPDGPAINERKEIGRSDECVSVWLVKPGPEPNGRGD